MTQNKKPLNERVSLVAQEKARYFAQLSRLPGIGRLTRVYLQQDAAQEYKRARMQMGIETD